MEFHLLLQSSLPAPELVFPSSSAKLSPVEYSGSGGNVIQSLFIVELSFFLLEYNERLDFEETAMKECLLNTRENPVTIQAHS